MHMFCVHELVLIFFFFNKLVVLITKQKQKKNFAEKCCYFSALNVSDVIYAFFFGCLKTSFESILYDC